jgi:hypothetical protein
MRLLRTLIEIEAQRSPPLRCRDLVEARHHRAQSWHGGGWTVRHRRARRAHAVGNHARRAPRGVELVGLCDAREERVFRRAVARVHVCNPDLEGELIRALGPERVLRIIDAEGELASFRTLQRQPAQRSRPLEAQLRRFLAGRAGNKERYARLLVEALDLDRAPAALDAALGRR